MPGVKCLPIGHSAGLPCDPIHFVAAAVVVTAVVFAVTAVVDDVVVVIVVFVAVVAVTSCCCYRCDHQVLVTSQEYLHWQVIETSIICRPAHGAEAS